MAKRRYRRFRRRSGRWSANIARIVDAQTIPSGSFANSITIAQNNTETSTSTISQAFTVKNIEVSAILESNQNINNLEYYIMYVPQGYSISEQLPFQHPEWILAYKFLGQNTYPSGSSGGQPTKVRSRLARKLQTGDSIIFFYAGVNSSNSHTATTQALIRWWTKAN